MTSRTNAGNEEHNGVMRLFMMIFVFVLVIGPWVYIGIWGPVKRDRSDRDMSQWGNPERDRVPGGPRRRN